MKIHRLVNRDVRTLSPWASLVTTSVATKGSSDVQQYHSFALDDYVNILAVTDNDEIPLVRQYRPALDGYSLELPGGLPDAGEDPVITAGRELYEETGYRIASAPELLGCLNPDSGRLENRLWGFVSSEVRMCTSREWQPEPGVEVILKSKSELKESIRTGEFVHALHIAIIGLAVIQGQFSFED